jgi:hypothetical protein
VDYFVAPLYAGSTGPGHENYAANAASGIGGEVTALPAASE